MIITVLNGYEDKKNVGVARIIETKLIKTLKDSGHTVYDFYLPEMNVKNCIGCLNCWVKAPGKCMLDDDGNLIAERYINSELAIVISPVLFGGHASHVQKVLERLIPNISPLFVKINGLYRHKKRYETYPKIVSIGILPHEDREDEMLFLDLTGRNSDNFHAGGKMNIFIYETQSDSEIEEALGYFIKDLEEAK